MIAEYKAVFLDVTATTGCYIVGSHNYGLSTSGRNGAFWCTRTQWELGYGEKYYWYGSGKINTAYTVKFSTLYDDAWLEVDGTRLGSASGQTVSTNNVYLLTNTNTLGYGSSPTKARVYYVKIWNSSGTLVRNYVPYVNDFGEVGMLDKVSNVFYGNDGTGKFIAGSTTVLRDTQYTVFQDITLTAVWTPTSNNLFTNGDFEDVYTQTDTGWDNSINGTLHATEWWDYNSGVDNASTVTHAHLKDISSTDSVHKHVFEMNWDHYGYLAASYGYYGYHDDISFSVGTYRVTMSLKGVSGTNVLGCGLYHIQASGGAVGFYTTSGAVKFGVTDWFRFTYTFTMPKIYVAERFFFYGCGWLVEAGGIDPNDLSPSKGNVYYLDDVFLEKIA